MRAIFLLPTVVILCGCGGSKTVKFDELKDTSSLYVGLGTVPYSDRFETGIHLYASGKGKAPRRLMALQYRVQRKRLGEGKARLGRKCYT